MAEWNEIVARFDGIADEEPKTKTAKIRQLLPRIEAAVSRGITLKRLAGDLKAEGLEISYHDFRVLLSRVRRAEARKQSPSTHNTKAPEMVSLPAIPAAPQTAGKPKTFTPASGSSRSWTYNNNPDLDDPKFKPSQETK